MRKSKISLAFVGAFALASGSLAATPEQVVQHHVDAMVKGDLAAVMSDYAADTVVVTPPGLVAGQGPADAPGVYSGATAARRVFATLLDKAHHPGVASMQTRIEPAGNGVALLRWVQFKGTPQQVAGKDVFVVRNNKIAYQAILPDPAR